MQTGEKKRERKRWERIFNDARSGNGIWWHTAKHGRRSKGERGEWSG